MTSILYTGQRHWVLFVKVWNPRMKLLPNQHWEPSCYSLVSRSVILLFEIYSNISNSTTKYRPDLVCHVQSNFTWEQYNSFSTSVKEKGYFWVMPSNAPSSGENLHSTSPLSSILIFQQARFKLLRHDRINSNRRPHNILWAQMDKISSLLESLCPTSRLQITGFLIRWTVYPR